MFAATVVASALTACAPKVAPKSEVAAPAACPVIASRGWSAWLNAMPGPGAMGPMLNITGEVDMSAPGFRLELVAGPADRAMPPSQRFRLVATAPDGMMTQVVTPTPVKYREKATYPSYHSIMILCGERAIATITEVPTVY
jgi:hypothetical protein